MKPVKSVYTPSKWGMEFHGRTENEVFGAGAAGPGKALALDTLVVTGEGMLPLADVHPGMVVFDHQGIRRTVVAETEVMHGRPCYELRFLEERVIADAEHLWVVDPHGERRIIKTTQLRASNRRIAEQMIARSVRPERPPIPTKTSPFLLTLCCFLGSRQDPRVLPAWSDSLLEILKYSGELFAPHAAGTVIVDADPDELKEVFTYPRRSLPRKFLAGSIDQRHSMLRGIEAALGDEPEVSSEYLGFIEDYRELVNSLGYRASMKRRLAYNRKGARMGADPQKLGPNTGLSLAKKNTNGLCNVKRLTKVDSVPVKCIQVSGSGTYLITRTHIVTHNSMVLLMDPIEQVMIDSARCGMLEPDPSWPASTRRAIEEHPITKGHSEVSILHMRRTLPRLTDTIQRAHRIFPQIDPEAKWSERDHSWTFSCGARYVFGHCKDRTDYNNYLGREFTHIGFDELVEFNREQFDFITSRLRTGDPVIKHCLKVAAMSNPRLGGNKGEDITIDDPTWVKKYFVDPWPEGRKVIKRKIVRASGEIEFFTRVYIPATLYDNPDPEFVRQYEKQLLTRPKHIRDAYLYGRWDTVIGSHFGQVWNPAVHVCEPFKIPKDWPVFRAGDWGYATNGNIGFYALSPEGTLFKFYELTFKQRTATEVALSIKAFEERNHLWDSYQGSKLFGPMDRSLWEERGSSFRTKYEEMIEVGVDWAKADQKSRAVNCEVFTQRLASHCNFTQQPGIVFFKNCVNSIQTIPALETDPNDLEVPRKGPGDHWYDETSYACQWAKQNLDAPYHGPEIVYNDDEESDMSGPRDSMGYWQG